MTLDKEDHRAILLQLVVKNNFPGEFSEIVTELKQALKDATVALAPVGNGQDHRAHDPTALSA